MPALRETAESAMSLNKSEISCGDVLSAEIETTKFRGRAALASFVVTKFRGEQERSRASGARLHRFARIPDGCGRI